MKTLVVENITLYKDKNLRTEYLDFIANYSLEVKIHPNTEIVHHSTKARVKCISVMGNGKSNFNKLHTLGTTNEFTFHKLIVNGKKTFFKIKRK